MRIKSNFHDYYDRGMAISYDDDILYIRDFSEEEVRYNRKLGFDSRLCDYSCYDFRSIDNIYLYYEVILFCGKPYPLIKVKAYIHNLPEKQNSINIVAYKIEDIDRVAEKHASSKIRDGYFDKKSKSRFSHNTLSSFFEVEKKNKSYYDYVEKGGITSCPIFLFSNKYMNLIGIAHNPCLKDIEFFRVMDSYAAFQEIQMYLANVAIPQKEMPIVSDDLNAESHGFDKYSFRKDKQK